jgi:uncharacterized spore protein YtfJ
MDVENLLTKATDNLSVRRAFGTAYEKDGMLIIPVAMVTGGGGGGTARQRNRDRAASPGALPEGGPAAQDTAAQDTAAQDTAALGMAAQDTAAQDPARTDVGGGFGGLVWPAGVYVVKGGQVRWVPAVDVTIVALVSLSLVRVLARTWSRSRRRGSRS